MTPEWTGMNRNDTGMDRNDTGMTPEWTGISFILQKVVAVSECSNLCTKAKGFEKHFFICMFYNYLLLIGRINSLCNDIYFTVTSTPSPPLSENYVIIYVPP